jgi:ribosome maturation factor RimP
MITKEIVENSLNSLLEKNYFVVDIIISPNEKVTVLVDNFEGIKLSECQSIHKKLYPILEILSEDFELEISSPGLTSPLKLWQQFVKNIGKEIEIETSDKQTFLGKITNADETKIELQISETSKIDLEYKNIKKAKQIIKF